MVSIHHLLARLFPPQTQYPDIKVIEAGMILATVYIVYHLTKTKKMGMVMARMVNVG